MKLHAKNASRRWWTRTVMAVAATAGSVVMLIAAPGAAHADSEAHYGSRATSLCLDANEVGDIYTSFCQRDNPWLMWQQTATTLGYQLRSIATDRCLDSNIEVRSTPTRATPTIPARTGVSTHEPAPVGDRSARRVQCTSSV